MGAIQNFRRNFASERFNDRMNTQNIKQVTVFCASSAAVDKIYIESAYHLGKLFATNQITCVCGAGNCGLMGAVSDGTLENGGKVTGVIPKFMVDNGWCHTGLTETIITTDMHERKDTMSRLADAVIALPGGCGTLEELLEIITWKQLGLFHGAIIILNINGYYNHLLAMLQHCIDEHFMKQSHGNLWHVASTPDEAVNLLLSFDPTAEFPIESKY